MRSEFFHFRTQPTERQPNPQLTKTERIQCSTFFVHLTNAIHVILIEHQLKSNLRMKNKKMRLWERKREIFRLFFHDINAFTYILCVCVCEFYPTFNVEKRPSSKMYNYRKFFFKTWKTFSVKNASEAMLKPINLSPFDISNGSKCEY